MVDDDKFKKYDAAECVYESYKIRTMPYEKWKPSKSDTNARRGRSSHPMKMTQKTGHKGKFSKKNKAIHGPAYYS